MKDEKLATDIAEWLKDHKYTCLADGTNGVEAWRCQKPGSIHLAFDICITRFGMSMFGDIDSLVFRVGASYGLEFLARKPSGYMHEKLDERYRAELEFDEAYFRERVAEAIFDLLEGRVDLDKLPAWMQDQAVRNGRLDDLHSWLREQADTDADDADYSELVEFLDQALSVEDDRAAHDLFSDNEDLLEVSDTWEYRFTNPSRSLVRRLHYISHAANQILAIKAASAEQLATDGGRNPRYEGLFEGETTDQRDVRLAAAKSAEQVAV